LDPFHVDLVEIFPRENRHLHFNFTPRVEVPLLTPPFV
jgi:hypothetical protein